MSKIDRNNSTEFKTFETIGKIIKNIVKILHVLGQEKIITV